MNIPLKQYWNLLAQYLRHQKNRFALLTVLLFGSIGLQILIPQITRFFIDSALEGVALQTLTLAGIGFVILAIVQQVVSVSAAYVGENVAWIATNGLREDLAEHCINLDMSFHNDTSPGELIERIDGDITALAQFFSQLVVKVLANLLLLAGILFALFFEDVRMGLAFTGFAVGSLLVLNRVRGIAVPYEKARREANAELFGYLEERLAGTEDIRSSGAVDYVINGLYRLQTVILERWQKAALMFVVVRFVAGMSLVFGYIIAFIATFSLFESGLITIGTVYLVIHYTNMLSRPFRELTRQVESLQNVGASMERVEELLAIESKIHDGSGKVIPHGALAVEFDNVSFHYQDDESVLQDINFNIQSGEILGLLGRTGSGKTTLARLLFRLYDPTQGEIRLNEVDIKEAKLETLRKRVAMVTQDVQLFQATVRDNLTFFDKSISDERISEVIDTLELSEWYQSLPNGLDTRIETGGRSLSAGEAQLLAFTRIFLRDPDLVILDEASSRLDPATERLIERAVDKLLQNRTGIIIAHRLGTVQRVDNILILSDGEILEWGDREVLADNTNSQFYHLLQTGLEEVLA